MSGIKTVTFVHVTPNDWQGSGLGVRIRVIDWSEENDIRFYGQNTHKSPPIASISRANKAFFNHTHTHTRTHTNIPIPLLYHRPKGFVSPTQTMSMTTKIKEIAAGASAWLRVSLVVTRAMAGWPACLRMGM